MNLRRVRAIGPHLTRRWKSDIVRRECSRIIIGAGSAGCVLANRISAASKDLVLLIEAGPSDSKWRWDGWKIHMPAALTYNLCNSKYNWYYHTVPQQHVDGRQFYWPRGRVWGGSSSLNAMVYVRGHAMDFNRWEQEGAAGWSYAHCLPYFRRAQTHQLGANDYRGGDGPLFVSRGNSGNQLFQAFIDAGVQAGYPFTTDMNGYQQEGFGWMDLTIHNGVRWSTASAYLRPALRAHANLQCLSKTLVTRILMDGRRAVGVEVLRNGQTEHIVAEQEVILCGGAINSPQLLMLSGIGDADHLRQLGINVVQHLPGVGRNLQDHLEVYVQQRCRQPLTLYKAQWRFPHEMLRIGAQWFLTRRGNGASSHLEAGAFVRTHPHVAHPDFQFHFLPSAVLDHGRVPPPCHAYQVHVGAMRPGSVGRLWLHSNNPTEHPKIDANYLSDKRDVLELRAAVRTARQVFAQRAFDAYRGEELSPGADVQSDSEVDAFVRRRVDSAYHPSCTCKMGAAGDALAVVDSQLRVFGVDGLRLVDASVMPSMISGNLNATVIMIAEKAADIILQRQPLPPSSAPFASA